MRFEINLATRIYIDFRKVSLVIYTLAALLVFWIFFSIYSVFGNYEILSRYKVSSNKSGRSVSSASENDYKLFTDRVKSVNAIIYKRSYDWLQLFDNLEQLVPDGVSVRGIEPFDKGESIKIAATGRNFNAVRKLVENLEFSKTFTDVNLVEQSVVKEGSATKVMNFTVTCKAVTR